jgi:choline-sulfatase
VADHPVRWGILGRCRWTRPSRRRLAVAEALGTGAQAPWDFSPPYDAARRYIRNHMDLGDLEQMARFPPAGGQARAGGAL